MESFRALVLADPALEARLGAIELPDAYVEAVLAIAAERDIALTPEAVRAVTRPDPLGIGRFLASPVTLDRWPSPCWLPARGVERGELDGGGPAFDWAWFGVEPLSRPFFEDEVRRFAPRPFSQMFRTRTDLAALVAGAAAGGPAPAGFIYHMSRCGSTLAAQMLAADPSHVVLSEPMPFDAVVRWAAGSNAPLADRVAALRAVAAALGRDRAANRDWPARVFLKLDSWHTLALPLLRAAFPDTPWIFLYRDPVEVVVSQLRQRGLHTVPGLLPPALLDIAGGEAMAEEEYVATAIARMNAAVLDHWDVGGGMLVNYAELPDAMVGRIAPHFGLSLNAGQWAAMAAVATHDAKTPEQLFAPDSVAKRREASPAVLAAVQRHLAPLHARLEALRLS